MRELEVKILNIDLEKMEEKIKSLGAKLISKEIQINILIDREDNYIEDQLDSYLRIRETKYILDKKTKITLTMKQNIAREGIRENIETNIDISDKEAMITLLDKLGYHVKDKGEKKRTSYSLNGARLDLDIWDKSTYPDPYMEIEVSSEDKLDQIIKLLNIKKDNISIKSILELRREKNLL